MPPAFPAPADQPRPVFYDHPVLRIPRGGGEVTFCPIDVQTRIVEPLLIRRSRHEAYWIYTRQQSEDGSFRTLKQEPARTAEWTYGIRLWAFGFAATSPRRPRNIHHGINPKGKARRRTMRFTFRGNKVANSSFYEGAAYYPESPDRPATWGECQSVGLGRASNPCPFVGCKYHLASDIGSRQNPSSITFHVPITMLPYDGGVPDLDLSGPTTCALVMVEQGRSNLQQIGRAIHCSRERVRQIEMTALKKMRHAGYRIEDGSNEALKLALELIS